MRAVIDGAWRSRSGVGRRFGCRRRRAFQMSGMAADTAHLIVVLTPSTGGVFLKRRIPGKRRLERRGCRWQLRRRASEHGARERHRHGGHERKLEMTHEKTSSITNLSGNVNPAGFTSKRTARSGSSEEG